ncbi:MAG: hypothetical protein U9N59_05675 [Campylobacterota bacterium]|nr:hypothetical protein [Campylobacterota bacterium]
MYKKKILKCSLAIIFAFNFNGCGGGSDSTNTSSSPEENAVALETQVQNIGTLSTETNVPDMPSEQDSKSTIRGIDSDNDGTRDDIEQLTYQSLNTMEGISSESYNKVISIMNMIQPKNPIVENSINKHEIYCTYRLLPDDIKKELPLDIIYSIVLNTQERKTAFTNSLEASIESLGAESCE